MCSIARRWNVSSSWAARASSTPGRCWLRERREAGPPAHPEVCRPVGLEIARQSNAAEDGMTLKLVRVDDRLIHGQVVAIWLKALRAQRIVIVDDRTAADEFLREILELAS
ncbi:MAG: PTS sugar transporter subunit IIB, partial [Chloroflexota bacterium]